MKPQIASATERAARMRPVVGIALAAPAIDAATHQAWAAIAGSVPIGPGHLALTATAAALVGLVYALLASRAPAMDAAPTRLGRSLQLVSASTAVATAGFTFGALSNALLEHHASSFGAGLADWLSRLALTLAAVAIAGWFAVTAVLVTRVRLAPERIVPFRGLLVLLLAIASALTAALPFLMALNAAELSRDDEVLSAIVSELAEQDARLVALHAYADARTAEAPAFAATVAALGDSAARIATLARQHAADHVIDPEWSHAWATAPAFRQAVVVAESHLPAQPPTTPEGWRSLADTAQRLRLANVHTAPVAAGVLANERERTARFRLWRAVLAPFVMFALCFGLAAPWLRLMRAHMDGLRRQARVLARTESAMLLTDQAWRIVWVNSAFERLTGFDADMARGQLPGDLLRAPETAMASAMRIAEAFRVRTSFRETLQTRTRDGRPYWAYIDMQPIHDDRGAADGFCMVIADVTAQRDAEAERQRSQAALAESEERFRQLADGASDIIVTTRLDGVIIYASPAVRHLGYEPLALVGTPVTAYVHPDDLDGFHQRREQMLEGHPPATLVQRVFRIRAADGRWVWVESSPNTTLDGDGRPVAVTAFMRDITARKEAEEALQEHVRILDSIAEVSGVGGWSVDLATGQKNWTAQTRKIYGVDDDYDPRMAQDLEFYPEDARAQVLAAIEAASRDGTPWNLEVPFVDGHGRHIWVRTAGRAQYRDGKVVALFGSFSDVTEEREARQRLILANDDARTALGALSSYQAALDRHGIVSMTDASGRIHFVNDRFCEVTGYTRDELIGEDHAILGSGAHGPALFAEMWDTISRGGSWRGELCNRAKDGTLRWLDTTIVPVCGADGVPERYISIRYDLTEQKRLEARSERLSRLRDGIAQVHAGYIEHGLTEALTLALQATIEATESEYGFIGEVLRDADGAPFLRTHAITDISWDEASAQFYRDNVKKGLEFRNLDTLFGAALRDGEPVITNDAIHDARAHGTPSGHPPLNAFLGIPIHVHGELAAMVGMANRPDGYSHRSIVELQPMLDAIGQLVRTARERAARETVESALNLERRRLRDVIEGTGVGIWSWNLATDEVWFNEHWGAILGYPSETLARWNASDFFEAYHPHDLEESIRRTQATFDGGSNEIDIEVRMRHAEGHWVWLHMRGSASSHGEDGKPTVLSGMAQDISERKHGERMRALINEQLTAAKEHAVRKSQEESVLAELLRLGLEDTDIPTFVAAALEATLRSIEWLRGSPHAVVTLHGDADATTDNAAGATASADAQAQHGPNGIDYYLPGAVQPAAPFSYTLALAESGRAVGTLQVDFPAGHVERPEERIFLERAGAALVTGVRHRATARKLRAAALAAESASIAKSQFLATMSHEIRTPMNGVLGTLDLLLGTGLDAEQRDWASTAHDSANQLLALLNQILDFSRLEANQVKLEQVAVNPRALLQRVLALHHAQAREKGIGLVPSVDASVPAWVVGDPTRIQQLLINLIGNAVKFTDHGEVRVHFTHDGERLHVDVADTGIGITADARAQLFNRFVQADSSITRRFGGTGLGLAICGQLVHAMGGEIGVHSTPGRGSRFWFAVPAAASAAPEMPAPAVEALEGTRRAGGEGLRVLVADDNPVNQRIMRAFLEGAGHTVVLVDDGAQTVAAHVATPFDIILMDVQMPVMDGMSATAAIRTVPGMASGVPIVAITANAMPGDREHYLAQGMNGYVSKPINRQKLTDAITRAMADQHRTRRDAWTDVIAG